MAKTAKFQGGLTKALELAVHQGYIWVNCPYCDFPRKIEPDGYYDDVECENCGKHYKTKGVC